MSWARERAPLRTAISQATSSMLAVEAQEKRKTALSKLPKQPRDLARP